jgi:hypothetical protein
MGNAFFMWKLKKIVAKVVGNAKMHISTKNGTMVPQFTVELAQTMVTWQGRPRELPPNCGTCTNHGHLARKTKRTPTWKHLFVKESTCEPLGCYIWYCS